ncbi:MAG: hypothetical protein M3137_16205 [Actinomycetota bacterium]|nr:hypothetical protein [Actinomycetota bacterium]
MLTLANDRLTTTEAGHLVGRTKDAIRNAINDGRLVGSNERGRWYVDREAVLAWDKRTRRYDRQRVTPAWARTGDLLAEYGSATVEELALLAGLHIGNVRKHLAILANLGRAERRPDGQWVLTAESRQGAA